MARDQLQRLSEPMYYLLLTLLEENHGYAMMHDIEMISKGRVKVGTELYIPYSQDLKKKASYVPQEV